MLQAVFSSFAKCYSTQTLQRGYKELLDVNHYTNALQRALRSLGFCATLQLPVVCLAPGLLLRSLTHPLIHSYVWSHALPELNKGSVFFHIPPRGPLNPPQTSPEGESAPSSRLGKLQLSPLSVVIVLPCIALPS